VVGVDEGYHFVSHALEAANWSREQLTPENFAYLQQLVAGPLEVEGLFTLAHGSPYDEEQYILGELDARLNFEVFHTPICFFGHSHVAVVIGLNGSQSLYVKMPHGSESYTLDFKSHLKYLINPGSVGQPRDGEWRGSAAVYNTKNQILQYLRFDYDLPKAQQRILQAGLPSFLAERLAYGR
jgi:diadenosine tetraphosphatase ApaH/serine/threonine PP2A family protein phosphatase